MNTTPWRAPRILAFCLAIVALASCDARLTYFLGKDVEREAEELYRLAETTTDAQVRATAVHQLSSHLVHERGTRPLIVYLSTYTEQHPEDPYNGFYLYLTGQSYLAEESPELALSYFERVVDLYPTVSIADLSLRESALYELVRLSPDPERRARYYRLLINEFPDTENTGLLYYRLAENLAELGHWDEVYQAYREILRFPEIDVPGEPDAYREIQDRVEFHDSAKNWTLATVEDLRRTITWALRNKDTGTLTRFQAKVNFFTRSWEQDFDDPNASPDWNIGELLLSTRRLSIRPEVDLDADGDEAYLWTFGWGLRIRTWYLYFRQVDYPPDPEIHGTWEWAGVFLGERL